MLNVKHVFTRQQGDQIQRPDRVRPLEVPKRPAGISKPDAGGRWLPGPAADRQHFFGRRHLQVLASTRFAPCRTGIACRLAHDITLQPRSCIMSDM